ncbi:hypothetical protein PUN4_540048 [Paraburkholderia unamae]|nr:hypothetical protein PUN4_540048 [Paraburkholderia unamae]
MNPLLLVKNASQQFISHPILTEVNIFSNIVAILLRDFSLNLRKRFTHQSLNLIIRVLLLRHFGFLGTFVGNAVTIPPPLLVGSISTRMAMPSIAPFLTILPLA